VDAFFAAKSPEDPVFSDFFPVHHTVRNLLQLYGDIFGMRFYEVSRDHQNYQSMIAKYLKAQDLEPRDAEALDVFEVCDTTGWLGKALGFLVLDLEDRDGKTRDTFSRTFDHVCIPFFNEIFCLLY
jgi:hypothetical protein